MTRERVRAAGMAGWLLLSGATFWLDRLGQGPLGGVPWSHPEDYLTWWRARGPLLASFATARQALFWVGCYLGAVWLLALVASAGRPVRLAAALAGGHLPGMRFALVLSGAAATWAAVNAAPATALTSQDRPGGSPPAAASVHALGPPVLRYVGPAGPPVLRDAGPPTAPTVPGRPQEPTTVPAPPPAPRSALPPTPPSARPPTPPPARPTARARSLPPAEPSGRIGRWWTVRPGDSLWSIAAASLSGAWGRPPDAAHLARYWWQVVAANRARLPNPADPNLLFPGDRVIVPTPPAPAAGGQPPD
jgi:hypothetical protein